MKINLNKIGSMISFRTNALFERAKMTEYTFMIILAILIGILAGFAAIGIRALINEISHISFPGEGNLLDNIISAPWYLKILIPMLGGLIVGPIIYFFAPEAKGHGVPEVMQAILQRGGNIRSRVAFVKMVASSITIGTGGSVGREGPIIQIGSSIGSMVGQLFRVPSKRLRTLVGCGAAAGIAAAFNAPIAGALFAVEIILMDFTAASFSPIVIASVMATVVSHTFEGDFAAFIVPEYELVSPNELIFYFILGALTGLISYAFIKVLYFSEDLFDKKFKFPDYLKPAIGRIGIGITALFFPHVMGVGYDSINDALHSNMIWYMALILIFVKIFATSMTLGSGGSGGIFAPSLFMGAMVGAFFGSFVHQYFPDITANPGAYALVAMGGLVAGTTRAPITAIIIVFELTNDYNIILPLMITCVISMTLSTKLSRESIYTLKLLHKNIGLKEGIETNIMEAIFVKDVINKKFKTIHTTENFSKMVNQIINGKGTDFPVVDAKGNITGMISINDIKDHLFERDSLQHLIIAADISNTHYETLNPNDNCQTALEKLRKYDLEGLPVTDSSKSKKIIGMIWRKEIQDAYQKEIERREILSSLASSITMKEEEPQIRFMEGYAITEITPPNSFHGKSIRQLHIRAKYGVDVLSIKSVEKGKTIKAIPDPEYVIEPNDRLIIAGEVKKINVLKGLR